MAAIAQWLVHWVVVPAMRVRSSLVAPRKRLPTGRCFRLKKFDPLGEGAGRGSRRVLGFGHGFAKDRELRLVTRTDDVDVTPDPVEVAGTIQPG